MGSDPDPDPATPKRPARVLSGVQPSGRLHLGNYFGAIRQHIAAQDSGDECFYFIANYHSLTTVRDREALDAYTRDVATTYLALGLDPARTVFYRQSDVPEVTELTWLLATVTPMGLLERAHSYKEKVAKGIPANTGLFLYPCLMAADILGPRADVVPVGQDQNQHVEMARDMAQAFHAAYCDGIDPVFALPATRLSPTPKVTGTTFEKGSVVQLTIYMAGRVARELVNDDRYRRFVRDLSERVAASDPESLSTTAAFENLATTLLSEHGFGSWIARCDGRTLMEMPGGAPKPHDDPGSTSSSKDLFFKVPHTVFTTEHGRRVAAKMSKSYGNTIEIFAEGKPLKKSVMGIETLLKELHEPLEPEGDLVLNLYRLFASPDEVRDLEEKYRAGGFGYGNAKKALLAKIDEHFTPFRARRKELESDPDTVEDVLRDGARRAGAVIAETLDAARAACGLAKSAR